MSASHWGMIEVLLTENDMKDVITKSSTIKTRFCSEAFGLSWGMLTL